MKRHAQLVSVLHGNHVAFKLCKHLGAAPYLRDVGRAYEGHRHILEAPERSVGMEAAQLPTVCVAAHRDGQRAEALYGQPFFCCSGVQVYQIARAFHGFGQKDKPRAGGKHRHASLDALLKGFQQP